MKKYAIPVMWSLSGYVYVDAENLEDAIRITEDAIRITEDADLPNVGEYVHDSFVVNVDEMADHESDYYVIE